jgi:hypothetical protein
MLCAFQEAKLRNPNFIYGYFINIGAFAATAFFLFLCALLLAVDAVFHIINIVKGRTGKGAYQF